MLQRFKEIYECVPLTISYTYISVQSKECYFSLYIAFVAFHQICVFIIIISFFDEVSNFCSRTLTNQKPELVIRNCQWYFMLSLTTQLTFTCLKSTIKAL